MTLVVGVLLAVVTVAVRGWFQAGDVVPPLDKSKPNHVVLTVAWRPTRTMLINWQVGPTSGKNVRLKTSPWTRVQYAARGELVRLNVHTVELVPDPARSLSCVALSFSFLQKHNPSSKYLFFP